MNFSLVQRRNLQKAIEEAIPDMKDCDHKQLFLVILGLLQDLSEAENGFQVSCMEQQKIMQ